MPLLGMYKKEMKTGSQRNACIPTFIAALPTTAETTQQPRCPSADTENVVYTDTHTHTHTHTYTHTHTHTHTFSVIRARRNSSIYDNTDEL